MQKETIIKIVCFIVAIGVIVGLFFYKSDQKNRKELAVMNQSSPISSSNSSSSANSNNSQASAEGAMVDCDFHTYPTVVIGGKEWMAKNLRTKCDRAGREIAYGGDKEPSSTTPYWYYPDGNPSNEYTYGLLYNAAAASKVCPPGWHLSTDEEWKQLEMAAGMSKNEADGVGARGDIAAKLCGNTGWKKCDDWDNAAGNLSAPGRNSTRFNVLPAGTWNGEEYFWGDCAYFWQPHSEYRFFRYDMDEVNRWADDLLGFDEEGCAISVRCVRN